MRRFQRAQVTLEISLTLIAVLLFVLGMLRIWFWLNDDLYQRQKDYISTRKDLGTWPIHESSELNDGVVFKGDVE